MPARLSRRRFVALLMTPALTAGCGLIGSSAADPTVPPAPATTPASAASAPTVQPIAPTGASTPAPATAVAASPAPLAPRPAATPAPADLTNARRGGRLTWGWLADARTLNPLFATDTASRQAASLLFDGLTRINPVTLQPEPALAERWEISPDHRTYTFRLRPGAVFHDGQPCAADDVKFTYDLLLSERLYAPARPELAAVIETITVVDPATITFRLKHVSAPFLARHAIHGIVPRHRLASVDLNRLEQSDFGFTQPVGAGPFRLGEWRRGERLALARHDAYVGGQPYLDEIAFEVVDAQDALHEGLRSGTLDLAAVREDVAGEIDNHPNLRLDQRPALALTYTGFQMDSAQTQLFQDQRVRQALTIALDREAMARQARFGLAEVATGPIPPPLWPAEPPLAPTLRYDPTRAEQLLDAAGWLRGGDGIRVREGQRLAFELLTNRSTDGGRARERYAEMMRDAWRAIGAEATVAVVSFSEVVSRLRTTHKFDVYLTAYASDADPDQRLLWSTDAYQNGFNASRYSNGEVDRLLTEAVRVADPAQRRALYRQAQEILLTDLPAIMLDYPVALHGLNERARNVVVSPVSPAYNAHHWWLAGGA